MKHFNTESKQTEIFNKYGAFFAFSQKQYNDKAIDGVEYASSFCGIIVPKKNSENLHNELYGLIDQKIKYELENNSIKEIIWYQLSNYESQISGDISSAYEAAEQYGITLDQVKAEYKEYFQHCVDNDFF